MERNPGAWRKMAGLLIFLALCILPCSAETSNRQRIIALDNEIYQDIDALYTNNDVEMFTYGSAETENLAWPKGNNQSAVEQMNQKLNTLIQQEIGVDDGHETFTYSPYGVRPFAKPTIQ